jgi:cell wall-associated NlpC family hydrolase
VAVGAVSVVVAAILVGVGTIVVSAMRVPDAAARGTVIMLPVVTSYPVVTNDAPQTPPVVDAAPIGNWTAERGRVIAERALRWRGWPYSFGAGDAAGPTYGHAVDHDSRNDARVRGFDCSGLVIYALAPWLGVSHSAAAQYSESGSVHPSLDALQPGDLVFWSRDGSVDGIGHVAIYIGNGYVVQAPRSGAYITVTRIDQVEPGRIGVTRPLT